MNECPKHHLPEPCPTCQVVSILRIVEQKLNDPANAQFAGDYNTELRRTVYRLLKRLKEIPIQ